MSRPPPNSRIATLTSHVVDVDRIADMLGDISLRTTPENNHRSTPAFALPPNARRDVGRWFGGICNFVMIFDQAFLIPTGHSQPVPLASAVPFAEGGINIALPKPSRPHDMHIELRFPKMGSPGYLIAKRDTDYKYYTYPGFFNESDAPKSVSDEEFIRTIRRHLNEYKRGRILLTQMKIFTVQCEMIIQGPPMDMMRIQRRLDIRNATIDFYGIHWSYVNDFIGSKPYQKMRYVRFTNHVGFLSGDIYLMCDANERRHLCGLFTEAAWGVGGSVM